MSESSYTCHLLSGSDDQLIEVTKEIIVGRGDSCDLIIKTGQTSRQHAKLTPTFAGLWVEDLNSSNGTFVNDQIINGKVLVHNNDVIKFDTVSFTVQHIVKTPEVRSDDATIVVLKKAPAPVEQPVVAEQASETVTADNAPSNSVAEQPAAKIEKTTEPEPVIAEPIVTQEGAEPESAAPKRDAVMPPSWAVQRQQSVAGTEILDRAKSQKLTAANRATLEKVTVPTLIGKTDPVKDMRFTLTTNGKIGEWEVGRAEPAAIVINHTSVSTSHAQILNDGARWKLIDLVSANGTYVNDVKGLTTYLKHGDMIRFGHIDCQFLLPSDAAAQPHIHSQKASTVVRVESNKKPINVVYLGALIAIVLTAIGLVFLR